MSAGGGKPESWLTRNWRPLIMLEMGIMLPLIGTGLINVDYLAKTPDQFWTLMTIAIGGYIGSRGAEKIVPQVATIIKPESKPEDKT